MPRSRSRTSMQNCSGSFTETARSRYNCPNPQEFVSAGTVVYQPFTLAEQISTMVDNLTPIADKKKRRDWARRQAALRKYNAAMIATWGETPKLRQFMPNHPCTHTTETVIYDGTLTTLHSKLQCSNENYFKTWSRTYGNGAIAIRRIMGTNDPSTFCRQMSINGTSNAYRKHDWHALVSDFNEATDSFLPSSMHLGETMYENGIFITALKYVINPTRAIKDFLGGVVKLGLEKKNLGTLVRILKGSSNAWLSYNFGVKPAVQDVISILQAHKNVRARLDYLSRNGGSYVPIRVRKKSPSSFSNSSVPSSYPTAASTDLRRWYITKESIGSISAWGKVREDLNWRAAWTAYLQYFGINKVIGLAWELIPFSFVLDWFTNTQERINELTRFRIGDPFGEVRNISCSLSEETKTGIFMLPGWDPTIGASMNVPTSHVQLATVSSKTYSRFLTPPETSGVVDFSALGTFHGVTGGALLLQRIL